LEYRLSPEEEWDLLKMAREEIPIIYSTVTVYKMQKV
jgi:hypothetical protein